MRALAEAAAAAAAGAAPPAPAPAGAGSGLRALAEVAAAVTAAAGDGAPSAAAAGAEPAGSGREAGLAAPLEAARRALLVPTVPSFSGRAPSASPRAVADHALAPLGAPAPAAADVADIAWLVNEVLVEQARRHGVDLS
jgi:hypothetical protein